MRETKFVIEEVFSSADERERRQLLLEKLRQFLKTEGANQEKISR